MSRHKRKRIKSCLRLSHLPVPKTPAARPPAASCVNESELGLLDLLLLVFGILLLCFCCSCCQCVRALVKTWLPICMRRDCCGVLSIVATANKADNITTCVFRGLRWTWKRGQVHEKRVHSGKTGGQWNKCDPNAWTQRDTMKK